MVLRKKHAPKFKISTAMKKTELQRHEFSFRPDTSYINEKEISSSSDMLKLLIAYTAAYTAASDTAADTSSNAAYYAARWANWKADKDQATDSAANSAKKSSWRKAINLANEFSKKTTTDAAMNACSNTTKNSNWNSESSLVWNAAWNAYTKAMNDDAMNMAWNTATDTTNEAVSTVSQTRKRWNLFRSHYIGEVSYKVSQWASLIAFSENIDLILDTTLEALEDYEFNITKDQLLKRIKQLEGKANRSVRLFLSPFTEIMKDHIEILID